MSRLVKLTLATIYLTYLAMFSEILDIPRSYVLAYTFGRKLLNCPICTGFWMALAVLFLPRKLVLLLAVSGGNYLYWRETYRD